MTKLTKKTKMIIASVGVVAVLAVGGSVYASSQSKQRLEAAQAVVMTKTTDLKKVSEKIDQLFDKKETGYLVANVSSDKVEELRKEFDAISLSKQTENVDLSAYNKEIEATKESLEELESTFNTQTAVNQLFKQDKDSVALNGSTIKNDLPIVDDLKKEVVESAKKEYIKTDSTIKFDKTVNELIQKAEEQLKQIDTATQAVGKIFKDNIVVSTDQKLFDSAQAETNKVKNDKVKKTLSDQLAKVKSDINTKAEEKKKEEQKVSEANAEKNETQAESDVVQDQAPTDNGSTNTEGYVPQAGNDNSYQEPQYQAPAPEQQQGGQEPTPQAPTNGGGQTTPPASNNNNSNWDKPTETTPNANGGDDHYWGFD